MPFNSMPVALRPVSFLLGLTLVLSTSSVTNQQLAARTSNNSRAPSQVSISGDWARYAVKNRGFSVLLPRAPAMSTYEVTRDPLSRIHHIIGVYSDGVVYSIQILERKLSLQAFIDEVTRSSTSKFKRDLKVAGISGKEYGFEDDTRKAITQYFSTSRYIYVFDALGSLLGNPDVGMPRFFESIRFEPAQTALAITNGIGEEPAEDPTSPNSNVDTLIFSPKEVTRKAIVVQKPEPTYTENARQNQVMGTVALQAVFSSSGAVTSIRLVSGLPHGLSEKAIASARQIKFIPAVKDGHFVSMHVRMEYSFNLY